MLVILVAEARVGRTTLHRRLGKEEQGFADPGMQPDTGYPNQGYSSDPGMGGGYNPGGRQDIDLDDDFNFDFIKPGK